MPFSNFSLKLQFRKVISIFSGSLQLNIPLGQSLQ